MARTSVDLMTIVTDTERSICTAADTLELAVSEGRREVNRMAVTRVLDFVRNAWRSEQGQTMAEYGVILAVVTVGIVAALTALSGGVQGAVNNIVQTLTG